MARITKQRHANLYKTVCARIALFALLTSGGHVTAMLNLMLFAHVALCAHQHITRHFRVSYGLHFFGTKMQPGGTFRREWGPPPPMVSKLDRSEL